MLSAQDSFWDRIQLVRNTELQILWRTFVIDSTNVFLLNAIPTVVSVSTFTAYILMGNNLTAAKVIVGRSMSANRDSPSVVFDLWTRYHTHFISCV